MRIEILASLIKLQCVWIFHRIQQYSTQWFVASENYSERPNICIACTLIGIGIVIGIGIEINQQTGPYNCSLRFCLCLCFSLCFVYLFT